MDSLTDDIGPVHGVVDNVGGPALVQAFGLLEPGGAVVSVGRASEENAVFAPRDLMGDWGRSGRTIRTFFMPEEGSELYRDIGFLLRLANQGRLRLSIDHREELYGELTLLRSRQWQGKAVIRLPLSSTKA